ncbi:MAG: rod shape-determining protein MreD [Xanthomonadales bacterium]|jgi:rod shape-determining protein MreD|nr:rod shape-determining protein MreD [Xanthomonadales bacterium]
MVFWIALAAAGVLTLVPLPDLLEPLRPYWIGLVIIYWAMEVPDPIHLGGAFLLGLLLDLLTASLMGMHALSLVVLVYLVRRFRARMRFFPPWQQALAVLALLVNDRIIQLWALLLLGEPMPTWRYWLAPLVGMAVWPWLFLALDQARLASRQVERR